MCPAGPSPSLSLLGVRTVDEVEVPDGARYGSPSPLYCCELARVVNIIAHTLTALTRRVCAPTQHNSTSTHSFIFEIWHLGEVGVGELELARGSCGVP
jgi:hypothetical protein